MVRAKVSTQLPVINQSIYLLIGQTLFSFKYCQLETLHTEQKILIQRLLRFVRLQTPLNTDTACPESEECFVIEIMLNKFAREYDLERLLTW